MKILILASGGTSGVTAAGGYPLFLTEFDGQPLIEKIIAECLEITSEDIIVSASQSDITNFKLASIMKLISPQVNLVHIDHPTRGAACSALLSIDNINNEEELLILNANEYIDIDFGTYIKRFRSGSVDAGVLTFQSIHPRYSYVQLDKDNLVIEAAEKRPISRHATVGFYWFRQGKDFVDAAMESIRNNETVESLFYVCPTLNQLILKGIKVGAQEIPSENFHPLKDDKQISNYEFFRGASR